MYRNKWTRALLTDEEYRALREREVASFWNELSAEEKEEWGSFEEFRQKEFGIWPDGDFEYIGKAVEVDIYNGESRTITVITDYGEVIIPPYESRIVLVDEGAQFNQEGFYVEEEGSWYIKTKNCYSGCDAEIYDG